MKKHLIAVSLWAAFMPSLSQSAPISGNDEVEVKIDLNNVESLNGIFSGEISKRDALELSAAATDPQVTRGDAVAAIERSLPEISMASKTETVLDQDLEAGRVVAEVDANVKANANSEVKDDSKAALLAIAADSEQLALSVADVLSEENGVEEEEAAIILENFQPFTMPSHAIDYRLKAQKWAEKAPAAGEKYLYKSRVSESEQMQFQRALAEQIKKGALKEDELVTAKGLTPKGEALYGLLLESEGEGLVPTLYHVGRIENLLNAKNPLYQAEINTLLQDGALAYIRDMVMGIPELKQKDRDWLLKGRKVNAADTLITAMTSSDLKKTLKNLAPKYPEYHNLKRALQAFKSKEVDLEPPVITKGGTIKPGMTGDRVILMRDRLNYLGYDAGDSLSYDPKMVEAVKVFQKTHLLEPDGAAGTKTIAELNRSNDERIRQIQLNMERWRWMPETMGDHYIVVDIPGFRYSVVKEGKEVLGARTVVGREGRKTPVFMSPMSYIVFSPYWHVPRSMAVKDFLPRLKNNPYVLNRSKIRVFRAGQEIDPGTVDWSLYSANNFPFQLRQDPGDHNSLGRVKFMFPNEHAIYLHDTPSKSLFDRTSRDFSSGCVRIENPEELAEYFLGEKGWNQSRIKGAFQRTSEAHVSLDKDKKIPVYTLYMTTRVEGDSISFRADIYNKDKVLIEALKTINK